MLKGTCSKCAAKSDQLVRGLCPQCRQQQPMPAGESEESRPEPTPPTQRLMMVGNKGRCFGDYELLSEIARGGMGVIYKARQVSLNRFVAVKMILKGELASELEVQRFHREAEAAANLDHANIVSIYEVGEHEGVHYFSMRLVEGQSLNCQLDHYTRNLRASTELVAIVARAVHHAHQRGILHRDIKPGNILIDSQGMPHVTDFGLAKRVDGPSELTHSESLMGTPNYMSPEQAQGRNKALTTATDVWSLGGVLYRLITGQLPFTADTTWDMLKSIVETDPARPSTLNREVDPDLETICLKCLEKDPERRYLSAAALAEDLERYLRNEPIHAKPSTYRDRVVKWCRRKPLIASLAASLCAVAVLGFFGVLWQWREARQNAATAQKAFADASFSQAKAQRMSGASGQRLESINALRRASGNYADRALLRDEVIAAMALPDLAEFRSGLYPTNRLHPFEINPEARVAAEAELDGSIKVRSLERPAVLSTLPGSGSPVEKLRFGPGGVVLAVEYSGIPQHEVTVWNWQQQRRLFTKPDRINADAIDFSPDGTAIAIGDSGGRVVVYGIPGGKILYELELRLPSGIPRVPQAVRFHPDGKWLAESCLDDLYVQVWALGSGERVARLAHADVVHGLAWDPNGELLATACRDSNLYLWNTNNTSRPWKLAGHEGPAVAVAFSPSGTFMASLGLDETVRLWIAATGRQLTHRLDGESFERLQFSASSQMLIATDQPQRRSRMWQTFEADYAALHVRGSPLSQLNTMDFSPDGRWLAAATRDRAVIWDSETCRESMTFGLSNGQAAWFSADSQSLLVSTDEALLGVPVAGQHLGGGPNALWSQSSELGTMVVTPDRSLAAIAHPDAIFLVPLKSQGTAQARSNGVDHFYHRLALHPKGMWIAGMIADSSVIHLLDLRDTNAPSRSITMVPGSKYFEFSPDGHWLVTCWGGKYEFYEVPPNGRVKSALDWERPAFTISRKTASDQHAPFAFTSDGSVAALASTRYAIQLFRLPQRGTGKPGLIATLEAPDHYPLEKLAFSPDGRRLAAAVKDQTIQVWNLTLLGRHLAELKLRTDWPESP